MVVLNFTCQEKKQALLSKSVSQTIRTSVNKFIKVDAIRKDSHDEWFELRMDLMQTPNAICHSLHIWWNSRNFHVEDVCECGHPKGYHYYLGGGKGCFKCEQAAHTGHNGKSLHEFKLAKQGLGKSQFLGMGEITSIVRKKIWEINEQDALADGFKPEMEGDRVHLSASELLQMWLMKHNKGLTINSEVYIIQWRWVT